MKRFLIGTSLLKGLLSLFAVIPLLLQYIFKDFSDATNFTEVMTSINNTTARMTIIIAIVVAIELIAKSLYDLFSLHKENEN